MNIKNSFKNWPDESGFFGNFGGRYVAETLMPLIKDVEKNYNIYCKDKNFINELDYYLKNFVGRPSPLYYAERITKDLGGGKIYFKRDELGYI